jgi:hypothetical protein
MAQSFPKSGSTGRGTLRRRISGDVPRTSSGGTSDDQVQSLARAATARRRRTACLLIVVMGGRYSGASHLRQPNDLTVPDGGCTGLGHRLACHAMAQLPN